MQRAKSIGLFQLTGCHAGLLTLTSWTERIRSPLAPQFANGFDHGVGGLARKEMAGNRDDATPIRAGEVPSVHVVPRGWRDTVAFPMQRDCRHRDRRLRRELRLNRFERRV